MEKNTEKIVYDPKKIEPKWQRVWEESKIYKVGEIDELDQNIKTAKQKMNILDMFPYPSGEGLHAGHAKIFGASDIYSRFKRLQGFNVMHVQGYDSFGLPAEQFALKNKVNPKISTAKNVANFERQMKSLGLSYDWDRKVSTTDPEFYKWTQWIFKQLYKDGLVYESNEPINWCPSCLTGLANEDLENGLCERCGSVVEKKPIRQWSIKITEYAEKLLNGLENLDWKENIKEMQRNWIGKSVGAEIEFQLKKEGTLIRPNYVDDVQAPKEGLATTKRKGVMILIKHWSEDKYLLNISEKFNWKILFTGGVEVGESVYETTRREVLEETGYKNIRKVEKINFAHSDNFQRVHKGDNAQVEQTNMFVELENGEQAERTEEEKVAHKLEWHTREEMLDIIDRRNHKFVFDFATSGNHENFENIFTGFKAEDFFSVNDKFTIFTTRPDTLFGCTYCVFAPEHKLIQKYLDKNLITNKREVEEYIESVKNKTEIDRTKVGQEKTGVKINGIVAVNPINQKEIPVYIADYVLGNYGSGAIMAVPAHDERDAEFAEKFEIEKIEVVGDEDKLINSGKFDGLYCEEAKEKITEFVGGKMVTKYKLRDWVFARQRYWGEPFPIVFAIDDNGEHKPYLVADKDLPVVLPDVESYEPTGNGESPLANIKEFVEVYGFINDDREFESASESDEKATLFRRETNTMPQWAGSSWYWLRYLDPKNNHRFVGVEQEKYWSSNGHAVDMYLGGMEHATRHLIYARFWNQFLNDKGYLSHAEPFKRLEAVGLILGEDGQKMSKRTGNVVNPDDVIDMWGADTLRLYIAFLGDYHDSCSWDSKAIIGPRRFIERVWNLQNKIVDKDTEDIEIVINKTIKKVTDDYELLKFNTAIAQLMIFVNEVDKTEGISIESYKTLLKLISPICPFFTEEIWENLGETKSIHLETWPKVDESKLIEKNVNIAFQVNGKLRDVFVAMYDASENQLLVQARDTDGYKKWVGDMKVIKEIVVKNKIVNIII